MNFDRTQKIKKLRAEQHRKFRGCNFYSALWYL